MRVRGAALLGFALLCCVHARTSEFSPSIDLKKYLNDPAQMNKLVIQYRDSTQNVLFIYGTGRVVRQTDPLTSADLVPTCEGKVGQDRIRELLQRLISTRFFDLPAKSFLVFNGTAEDWKEMRLHTIVFDDGSRRAQRSFAYGTYDGKSEPVPNTFSDSEKLLQQLEAEAIPPGHCHFAAKLDLPNIMEIRDARR
jgi:hypothetical protein